MIAEKFFDWAKEHGPARLVLNSDGTGFVTQDGKRVVDFISTVALGDFLLEGTPRSDSFEFPALDSHAEEDLGFEDPYEKDEE